MDIMRFQKDMVVFDTICQGFLVCRVYRRMTPKIHALKIFSAYLRSLALFKIFQTFFNMSGIGVGIGVGIGIIKF